MDLDTLSLDELKKLQNDVAVAIFNYEKRKKAEAKAALETVAREHGFKLAELLSDASTAKPKSSGVAKYRNPENPDQTWTGKGRRPAWLIDHIAAGGSIEELEI